MGVAMSRMFTHVTETWNPVSGCEYGCIYCYARFLTRKWNLYGGSFKPKLHMKKLGKVPAKGFVFVCDMADLWGDFIPDEWILKVLKSIRYSGSKAYFLFLTRNPRRYLDFKEYFTERMYLGITLETNLSYKVFEDGGLENVLMEHGLTSDMLNGYPRKISLSIDPPRRMEDYLRVVEEIPHVKRFISLEPILLYEEDGLIKYLDIVRPDIIYIGYDNYGWRLPEPPISSVYRLVDRLRDRGHNIHLKTIRRAWYE